jgi:hypothetical protein
MIHKLLRARAACDLLSAGWVQQSPEDNRTLLNSQDTELPHFPYFVPSRILSSIFSDWSGITGKNGTAPPESGCPPVQCKRPDSANGSVAIWSETA